MLNSSSLIDLQITYLLKYIIVLISTSTSSKESYKLDAAK